jgi:hypothetical protein
MQRPTLQFYYVLCERMRYQYITPSPSSEYQRDEGTKGTRGAGCATTKILAGTLLALAVRAALAGLYRLFWGAMQAFMLLLWSNVSRDNSLASAHSPPPQCNYTSISAHSTALPHALLSQAACNRSLIDPIPPRLPSPRRIRAPQSAVSLRRDGVRPPAFCGEVSWKRRTHSWILEVTPLPSEAIRPAFSIIDITAMLLPRHAASRLSSTLLKRQTDDTTSKSSKVIVYVCLRRNPSSLHNNFVLIMPSRSQS